MAKVVTIPATRKRFSNAPTNDQRKRRVAGYARVSTDSEDQLSSYDAQCDYYTNYIKSREDWEFVGMYSDEGITACNTRKRDGFNHMVADALEGRIDLILTKSVSRFARNTVDSLSTIRKLKEHGTEVYFEKENVWTFDTKGELMITILSSLAQEESRSISENSTWGIRKRFQDGKVSVPFSRFLGYDRGENGELVVNHEQAKLVQQIFGLYLQGKTAHRIARMLTEACVPTVTGKTKWTNNVVMGILTNEKYKGDALLQKEYTTDFLTKRKKKNEGEVPQYYVEGDHEAIIDPETFARVQDRIAAQKRDRAGSVNLFSGKIKCGDCGGWYGSKVWHSTDKYRKVMWRCNRKYAGGRCTTPSINEEAVKMAFVKALGVLGSVREDVIDQFEAIRDTAFGYEDLALEVYLQNQRLREIEKQMDLEIAYNARFAQDQEAYAARYRLLEQEYEETRVKLETDKANMSTRMEQRRKLDDFMLALRDLPDNTEVFNEQTWVALCDHATIYSDGSIRITFKNGQEVQA